MDTIKWFNGQKPITLAFITAITCEVMIITLSYFTDTVFKLNDVLKFSGAISLLMFFVSWALFYMGERSSFMFEEIDALYWRAKKIKTVDELLEVNSDYIDLRNKVEHSGHYAQLNIIKAILETKKEFYEL